MQKLSYKINTSHVCRILTGRDIVTGKGHAIKPDVSFKRAVVITDTNIEALYPNIINSELAGIARTEKIALPPGEEQKSLQNAIAIYESLAKTYADRKTAIIALGGGVIGDLAGFVAATYLRGIPLIQIPTSLVAQVDSSIGGKVAVNQASLKNQIGTFYHPDLVLSDPGFLDTLPEEEYINGMAEVIKSAIVFDEQLFSLLETSIDQLLARNSSLLEKIVTNCISIKTQIVEQDERDGGSRLILNFGHTIAHGLETAAGFTIKHGQAVAIGMMAAARLSQAEGLLGNRELDRLEKVIHGFGLPTMIPDLDANIIMEAIRHDKKIKNGNINFILLRKPGMAIVSQAIDLKKIRMLIEAGR